MNTIINDAKNRLTIDHTSSLIFLKLVGPPLSSFKPEKRLRSHRTATDTRARVAVSDCYSGIWGELQ